MIDETFAWRQSKEKNKIEKKFRLFINRHIRAADGIIDVTKIGDIILNENLTKLGEKSFTKKSENFSESLKISIKKSQKLAKIQGNHQN